MFQVTPCILPDGFVAWRPGINEQWAECPWQAAALAARSDPMSERVTQEQVAAMRERLTKELAELPPAWPSTSAVLEEAEQMLDTLAADRDEQAKRAEKAEADFAAAVKISNWWRGEAAALMADRDCWRARAEKAEAECKRLTEIVERLPMTADGVPVLPGDTVWWPYADNYFGEGPHEMEVSQFWDWSSEQEDWEEDECGIAVPCRYVEHNWVRRSLFDCYSTREAAEAAAKEGE